MMENATSKNFSPEQNRAIRLALAAFGTRIEVLSRCGESPSQAMEATLREARMSPSLLAEWIPHEPGVNDDMADLFRRNGKLLWRVLLSLKCNAGQRISRGEEAQQAIRDAISEYSPSRGEGTPRTKPPAEDRPLKAEAPDLPPACAVPPKEAIRESQADPALAEVGGDPEKICSACGKAGCFAAVAGTNVGRSSTRIPILRATLASRSPNVWRWAFSELRIAGIPVPSSQERICFLVSLCEAIHLDAENIRHILELFELEMQ